MLVFGYCLVNSSGVILRLCTSGTRHISNGDISDFGKLIARLLLPFIKYKGRRALGLSGCIEGCGATGKVSQELSTLYGHQIFLACSVNCKDSATHCFKDFDS